MFQILRTLVTEILDTMLTNRLLSQSATNIKERSIEQYVLQEESMCQPMAKHEVPKQAPWAEDQDV